ncbi:GGDEF domain-containing protein [Pseudomonas daroniae]|uniref:diguanylate cyclase n=1 Tax=Phytopseudomonas daroniae TaxID=2487519 RepID=A0A4V2KAV9_9GAMM|nr:MULTISPECIES: GGDEF domain-containing protein [Pseudomonas]TBU71859.1 GGDEF domain-containing protein [Pseudomonas daroniae]TBU80762.1 GGDEF domain-containing protein [Pseudomonas daroniae]TBU81797.1 GGDEF domain-containing protein [Pseudomonas sp. FRB 228]TBU90786.1 GGDEF domain-containing protein [Pseudomonas daroniae]
MKAAHWQTDLQQIRHLRLFNNVALGSLTRLLDSFRPCDLDTGEVVLSPFDRNQYLYIVVNGSLKVYLGSLDNQPVTTLRPGDCAGEISFIDNEHPSAYVVATEPSSVLRLHRDDLNTLFQQSPQMMQNLLEVLCSRVRQGNRQLIDSEQNANVDKLTGAFNRRWLEHVFERERTRCLFSCQPLSLLMLDVDHFKDYNDRHGHLAGDYALCLVAHTLRRQLRTRDSLVRFGGEEFVILLPELPLQQAADIAERLRESLEQIGAFYSPLGAQPGVTISLGLTQMVPKDSLTSLIARADQALYRAKNEGRNRLCH